MENYPVSGQIDSRLKVELKFNLLSAKHRLSYYKALPAFTSLLVFLLCQTHSSSHFMSPGFRAQTRIDKLSQAQFLETFLPLNLA